jgi:hypothetical protein
MCGVLAGCHGTSAPAVDDAGLTSQVQERLASDSGLAGEPVLVNTQGGTVTLTGAVSNVAARSLAANDAAAVNGVKKVINSLTVGPAPAPIVAESALAPAPRLAPAPAPKPRVEPKPVKKAPAPAPAPISRVTPAPVQTASAPLPSPAPAPRPAAPPPPISRTVTLPAGSTVPIRVTQTLDSATAQPGDRFTGSVAVDVVQDGMLLLPRGASVSGRVTEVHEAGHFKGSSLLTVELTGVDARGERLNIATEPYTVEGKGRGKNTAVKTGVGAAAGALLGGIFGGGKGAAIGAVAGGGTGAGINAVTKGQQVQIPSESIVRFTTTNSLAVRTSTTAAGSSRPSLSDRDQ